MIYINRMIANGILRRVGVKHGIAGVRMGGRGGASYLLASLHEMLHILGLTLFEKMLLNQLLNKIVAEEIQSVAANPLNLFD